MVTSELIAVREKEESVTDVIFYLDKITTTHVKKLFKTLGKYDLSDVEAQQIVQNVSGEDSSIDLKSFVQVIIKIENYFYSSRLM